MGYEYKKFMEVPTETITIDDNGTYDVLNKASANVVVKAVKWAIYGETSYADIKSWIDDEYLVVCKKDGTDFFNLVYYVTTSEDTNNLSNEESHWIYTNTGILEAGSTSATVQFQGMFLGAYVTDLTGNKVVAETVINDNNVKFDILESNPTALNCVVLSVSNEEINYIKFARINETVETSVFIDDSDNWSYSTTSLETTSNKTQRITSTSTTEQYPSASAVYNELTKKQDNLPDKVNGNYLHVNKDSGDLEWSSITDSGAMMLDDYDPETTSGRAVKQAGGIPAYVEANGGKIDHIKLNDVEQEIVDKTVNLTIDETAVSGLTARLNVIDSNLNILDGRAGLVEDRVDEHDESLQFIENRIDSTDLRVDDLETNKEDKLPTYVNDNYLHVNNSGNLEWAALEQNSGVFIAEYNVSTYAEVLEAYNAGKHIVLKYSMGTEQYPQYTYWELMQFLISTFTFKSVGGTSNLSSVSYIILNSSGWQTGGKINWQKTDYLVTSISSSSTDTQYPSAKAAYTELNTLKQADENIKEEVDSLSDILNTRQERITPKTVLTAGMIDAGIAYVTEAPTSVNTQGLRIALLDEEPEVKYGGWIYLIKE